MPRKVANPKCRLPTPWQCSHCKFQTTWKPSIPNHQKRHTQQGRQANPEPPTTNTRQRRGHQHPLWSIRWRPLTETGDAWFHSTIEAPTQTQATAFLKAHAGAPIHITHQGPAMEQP